jgi:hypothetical protein
MKGCSATRENKFESRFQIGSAERRRTSEILAETYW